MGVISKRTRSVRKAFDEAELHGKVAIEPLITRAYNIALHSKNEANALRAIEIIADRWFGKPPQSKPDEVNVTRHHEVGHLPGKAKSSEEWAQEVKARGAKRGDVN